MVLERSSAAGLVAEAYLVRCTAGMLWVVDLVEVLEVGLVLGSQLVAFGRRKEAVADAAEVADKMIDGGA